MEIIRTHSPLSRTVWRFGQGTGLHFRVEYYAEQIRVSTGRQWYGKIIFHGWDNRSGNIQREDIPLPDDVIAEVISRTSLLIQVTR